MTSIRILAPGRDFRYAAKHPLDLAEALARHGFQVEVVAPMACDVAALHSGRGFSVRALPSGLGRWVPALRSAENLILAGLRGLPFADVTIGVDPPGFLVAHQLKQLRRTSVVVYYALELILPEERPDQQTVRYQANHLDDVDLVIITGEHRAQAMQQRFGLPVTPWVIHNTFVTPQSWPEPTLRAMLAQRGVQPTERLVLFLGKLFSQHALSEVVESIPLWPVDSSLVLAGYGDASYVTGLFALAASRGLSDRVHYLGTLPPGVDSVFALMRDADIGLVLKQYRDGILNDIYYTPTKLFEYEAAGLPVICSDQESLRFVEDEGWGVCVDVEQPEQIGSAVRAMLGDSQRLAWASELARQRFAEVYCMEKQVLPLVEFLQQT